MITDAHVHVIVREITRDAGGEPWRPRVWWEGGRQLVELGGRTITAAVREFVDVDRILAEHAAAGVERLVLSPWVPLLRSDAEPAEALASCRIQNDALAAIAAAHPERARIVGGVPLQSPEAAAEELRELMRRPGVVGVEVTASVRGAFIGDGRFEPFWAAAEETGALVFVHPTLRGLGLEVFEAHYLWNTVANPIETAIAGVHLAIAGVMERHPRLRVLLAHGGGVLPSLRGRLRHAEGFRPEARESLQGPIEDSLRRFYFDSITHDHDLLRDLVGFAGADRIVLGSDAPFDMGMDRPVEFIRSSRLPEEVQDAILEGNADRLLAQE